MAHEIGFFINLCKPRGITSFDCIRKLRRITGIKKMGHLGTLDPPAMGVLPVAAGKATRLIRYLEDSVKVYQAVIKLGIITDTDDTSGRVIGGKDPSGITALQVEEALKTFTGRILQRPPAVSAVKVAGRRAYELAREGMEVPVKVREALIYRIDLLDYRDGLASVEMETARGVYVRSVARDLGELLKCGGAVEELKRLKSGGFSIEDSVTPEQAEEAISSGRWEDAVVDPLKVMTGFHSIELSPEEVRYFINGREIDTDGEDAEGPVVVTGEDAGFIGIGRIKNGVLAPETVLV